MEIIDLKDGYKFQMINTKSFAVSIDDETKVFCPFCYSKIDESTDCCPACHKNIPQLIYFHGDDQTWIASGNE